MHYIKHIHICIYKYIYLFAAHGDMNRDEWIINSTLFTIFEIDSTSYPIYEQQSWINDFSVADDKSSSNVDNVKTETGQKQHNNSNKRLHKQIHHNKRHHKEPRQIGGAFYDFHIIQVISSSGAKCSQ